MLYEVARVVTGSLPAGALVWALPAVLGRLIDARHLLALTRDTRVARIRPAGGLGRDGRTTHYLATFADCAEEGRAPSPYARGLRYSLTAPMHATGRLVGTLSLWRGERPYSRADEELVLAVAAMAGLRLTRPSGR